MLNKFNVLLLEKQEITTTNAVKNDDNKIVMIKGIRVFRIVRPNTDGSYTTIAQYDHDKDFTDLSKLHKYKNYYLCSVDIDNYNQRQLIWNCCRLSNGADDSTIFNITENRRCTSSEVETLNKVFVDYYNEADRRYQAKLKKESKVKSQIIEESDEDNDK